MGRPKLGHRHEQKTEWQPSIHPSLVLQVLCFVAMCATLEVGPTPNVMILFCIVEGVFYMAQWEEYHTGTLNWSNGYMGVTESQVIQMGLFVVSAFFGE